MDGHSQDNLPEDNQLELNNADEIVEVIEFDPDENDLQNPEVIAGEMLNMDLENYIQDQDSDGEEHGAEAMEFQDDSAAVFGKHTKSVFCVNIDPKTCTLAVSGGEDDRAYVWNISNGETVFECTGHKDSVTCASFSHDGKYVVTGDMGGFIQVWNVDTKNIVWSFETTDLEWLEWHHSTPVLTAGTVEGDIWMWKVPAGDCKTFQGHGQPTGIGKIMPDGKRLCVGYEDGSVKLWDLKGGNQLLHLSGHLMHEKAVTCMDCHHDNNLVVTGSEDVTARILNSNTGKVLATLNCGSRTESDEKPDSIEAVGFAKGQTTYIATGTLAGELCIWDIPTQIRRHKCKHEAGIVRLKWDAISPLIYTCTLDGIVHLWDSRSGNRESQWYGHTEEILDFDISRDSNTLVTASGDKTARVFSLHIPDR